MKKYTKMFPISYLQISIQQNVEFIIYTIFKFIIVSIVGPVSCMFFSVNKNVLRKCTCLVYSE